MLTHPRIKGAAAGAVVVALVGVGQVALPAAASAGVTPAAVRAYGQSPQINVSVNPGSGSLTVTVAGEGTVTLFIAGRSLTQTLVNGQATFGFPADLPLGRYPFRVSYNGPGSTSSVLSDTLFVTRYGTVIGISAYRALLRANAAGPNRPGTSGADSDSSFGSGSGSEDSFGSGSVSDDSRSGGQGMLPATGASTQTELLGVLGLGLLTAGGASIVIARRRARI